ncbi:helix-turn-helix transcriptional regulator [Amycolatopsis sp. NPDC049688]|uniref:PadR family transcriptional regulator n=1 Tax=Amycolatopsis sp. NPDC049688 TaxID=3154733 RepID=UPI00341E9382
MGMGFRVTEATLDVLEVLLGPDDDLYGLRIAKAIGRPTGSVFPILARLEQHGWVISEWESGDPTSRGARRRFYRLSPEGLADARALLSERRSARRLTSPRPVMRQTLPGPESAS